MDAMRFTSSSTPSGSRSGGRGPRHRRHEGPDGYDDRGPGPRGHDDRGPRSPGHDGPGGRGDHRPHGRPWVGPGRHRQGDAGAEWRFRQEGAWSFEHATAPDDPRGRRCAPTGAHGGPAGGDAGDDHGHGHGRGGGPGRGRGPGGRGRGRGPGGRGPGGPGGPFGRGGDPELPGFLPSGARVGRGDIRAGILVLLLEGPMHGYQLIHELRERSGGVWRPSPGSVYPTLKRLSGEGLVESTEGEGRGHRKAFALTDAGTEEATRLAAESTPWEALVGEDDRGALELRDLVVSVVDAARQVVRVAEPGQAAEARQVLIDARRRLYGILAAEPAGDGADGADGAGGPAAGDDPV